MTPKLQTEHLDLDTLARLIHGGMPPGEVHDWLEDRAVPLGDVALLWARDSEACEGLDAACPKCQGRRFTERIANLPLEFPADFPTKAETFTKVQKPCHGCQPLLTAPFPGQALLALRCDAERAGKVQSPIDWEHSKDIGRLKRNLRRHVLALFPEVTQTVQIDRGTTITTKANTSKAGPQDAYGATYDLVLESVEITIDGRTHLGTREKPLQLSMEGNHYTLSRVIQAAEFVPEEPIYGPPRIAPVIQRHDALREHIRFLEDRIAAGLGIPPHLLGATQDPF